MNMHENPIFNTERVALNPKFMWKISCSIVETMALWISSTRNDWVILIECNRSLVIACWGRSVRISETD